MNHSAALFQPLVENEDNDEEMSECKIFHGQFGPLFHAGSLCLGLAFAMPQWLKFQKVYLRYSRVPIRRHGTFIRHTPFIRPNTFSKKWAVPFNWISMSKWSTFRYKFVCINLHLLYRPRHMCPIHFSSCVPLRLFRTPLLIGTRVGAFGAGTFWEWVL